MPEQRDRGNGTSENGAASLSAVVEGVLFVSDGPVSVSDLARALGVERPEVEHSLGELMGHFASRGIRLQRTNGHVQLVSAPEVAWAVERYLGLEASAKLSAPALETLSIIAYKQPVTRPEIEAIRGVDSEGVVRTLIGRGLIEALGHRLTVGHPIEYGTTFLFLEYFGLGALDDLPPLNGHLELAERVAQPALGLGADGSAESEPDGEDG